MTLKLAVALLLATLLVAALMVVSRGPVGPRAVNPPTVASTSAPEPPLPVSSVAATRPDHPKPRPWHLAPRRGDPTPGELAQLRWCESGRDHSAGVGSHEKARGLYKFMRATWRSVGGHGDPARASYAEQTYRTILLFRREGWTPWRSSSACTGLR
jgi:hypothetical protein